MGVLWHLLTNHRNVCLGGQAPQLPNTNHSIVREHSNENQVWCVNMGEYIVFGSIVGSIYYAQVCPGM